MGGLAISIPRASRLGPTAVCNPGTALVVIDVGISQRIWARSRDPEAREPRSNQWGVAAVAHRAACRVMRHPVESVPMCLPAVLDTGHKHRGGQAGSAAQRTCTQTTRLYRCTLLLCDSVPFHPRTRPHHHTGVLPEAPRRRCGTRIHRRTHPDGRTRRYPRIPERSSRAKSPRCSRTRTSRQYWRTHRW